ATPEPALKSYPAPDSVTPEVVICPGAIGPATWLRKESRTPQLSVASVTDPSAADAGAAASVTAPVAARNTVALAASALLARATTDGGMGVSVEVVRCKLRLP